MDKNNYEGIVLVDKSKNKTSFSIISTLRKILNVKKIGHAGTLDPLATGLMIILVGKNYTKKSENFINKDKEYLAKIHLGYTTKSFDSEMPLEKKSDLIPSLEEIKNSLKKFNGDILQIPPMFSAKKINGQKLYKLARKDIKINLKAIKVNIETTLISYSYPYLEISVKCSKGTYIRSLANDIGEDLNTGAFLADLVRTKCAKFDLINAIKQENLSLDTIKFIK
jgi:tRNA pseudouridine55 synthase